MMLSEIDDESSPDDNIREIPTSHVTQSPKKPEPSIRPTTWAQKPTALNNLSQSTNTQTALSLTKSRPGPHDHSPSSNSSTKISRAPNKVSSVLLLNVGGVFFTTLRTTLLRFPDSMLAAMFSGRHELQVDSRGAYFIDRNGTYFGYILEFLRADTLPPNEVATGVLMEARYYGLEDLEDRMSTVPSISALIVKENHRMQFPEYLENKKRIIQIAMENATVNKTGEVLIYAFRTEFVPKAPNFNVNHHCSADQAHISIGPWESIADEETLIKCLESDLIDEHFNVRVHEGKRRCKYFYGQSCQKCLFRIQIVFG